MELSTILALLAILLFAVLSFFFALAETALFSLGRWRAAQLVDQSPRLGKIVSRLLREPQDLLATIVLGNTFANAALVATGLWIILPGTFPIGLGLFILLSVILIAGEVIPKTLAVRAPEQWALRVAAPMLMLDQSMLALRQIAQRVNEWIIRVIVPKSIKPQTSLTEEEYQEMLEMAYQQGALARSEKEIILQIISLDQRTVKEAMKPRAQMASISDDLSLEDMLEAARKFKHRRLPVYDETPDTIVGVLNTRALLLDPNMDLAEAIEFPSFVPETMNLLRLLRSLQRQQRGIAIVLDEFGGTAGIITVEDILEEVVGEIRSEGESETFVFEKLSEGRWRVSGTMRVDDFRREYPEIGEVSEVDTMGGLLTAQLNTVPEQGQSTSFRGLKLTAQSVDERRVRELLVEVAKRRGAML